MRNKALYPLFRSNWSICDGENLQIIFWGAEWLAFEKWECDCLRA